jgi:hypothetical protein
LHWRLGVHLDIRDCVVDHHGFRSRNFDDSCRDDYDESG